MTQQLKITYRPDFEQVYVQPTIFFLLNSPHSKLQKETCIYTLTRQDVNINGVLGKDVTLASLVR